MIVWHVAKTEEGFQCIIRERVIKNNGRNVSCRDAGKLYAHVSLEPFKQGSAELDMIGANGDVWLLECEIEDTTLLKPDPSGDNCDWRVCQDSIPIKILHSVYFFDSLEYGASEKLPIKKW